MIPADMILDTASPRQAQACDGVVDFGDIDPFVLALSGPGGLRRRVPGLQLAQRRRQWRQRRDLRRL